MPTRSRNHQTGKEDRFTYRTSLARGRMIRQRALDHSEHFEDILDHAVDRYFKDPKLAGLDQPKNILETNYCRRVLKLLREKKRDAVCHKEMLDLILRNYE